MGLKSYPTLPGEKSDKSHPKKKKKLKGSHHKKNLKLQASEILF